MPSGILEGENYDLKNIFTPVKAQLLNKFLIESNYNKDETNYLVNGFKHGFSIEYNGPVNMQDLSANIPLRDIGTPIDLWNKVIKEVKAKRFA